VEIVLPVSITAFYSCSGRVVAREFMKNGLKIKGPGMFHGDGKPSPVMQVEQKTSEGKFSVQPRAVFALRI
jgi:hypothetical protein